MSKERIKFILVLSFLLIVSFGVLNLLLFLEFTRLIDEVFYSQALSFYQSKGKEFSDRFVFWKEGMEGYRVYSFRSLVDPFTTVHVGIPKGYFYSKLNDIFIRIITLEFILILALVLLYLTLLDLFLNRIREQNERLKDIGLALMHKAGNFLTVQKLNLSMLEGRMGKTPALTRMHRSLQNFSRDINLITHILEEREIKRERINLKSLLERVVEDLNADYPEKRVLLRLKDLFVYADLLDMESIVYNLVSNALKHSVSFVQVRLCSTKDKAVLVLRNDIGQGSGTGIGLKLLQRAVQRQGGQMFIKVKNTFTVFVILPLA